MQAVSLDLRSNLSEGKGVFVPDGHQAKVGNTDEISYVGILNKVLPPEIRVVAWAPVNKTLSARFDCRQRTYHYYFPMANLDIQVNSTQFKWHVFCLFFFFFLSSNHTLVCLIVNSCRV